jgi:general secretion pathway protein D
MNDLSKEKYNFIRALELQKKEDGLELLSDEKLPILPEWNDQLSLPPSFDEYMKKRDEDKTSGEKE